MYTEIMPNLYRIETPKPGCRCYLVRGNDLDVLIDSGIASGIDILENDLQTIGLQASDVDILINTHDHFDHIGGNKYFQDRGVPIAAHRNAAVKITSGDDEVLMCRAFGHDASGYHVHLWLENINVIDAGDWFLKILHTPGHTSGCICIYEPRKRILFSGDTVFTNGTISSIAASGSYGEYTNSLARLNTMKIQLLLPGHGDISENAEDCIGKALNEAKTRHEYRLHGKQSISSIETS
ncbi:MAG: MBL fold metallo-hydrolase [Chloroflexota bacterium]|nr:MBL fold metallo-hydrolase [Chloroflexota bacterium]